MLALINFVLFISLINMGFNVLRIAHHHYTTYKPNYNVVGASIVFYQRRRLIRRAEIAFIILVVAVLLRIACGLITT